MIPDHEVDILLAKQEDLNTEIDGLSWELDDALSNVQALEERVADLEQQLSGQSKQEALRNCAVYAERFIAELPRIVNKTIERRDRFPDIDPQRLTDGIIAHSEWRSALEAAIDEAKKFLDAS